MIQLPRNLQQIHIFEEDNVWYVANLQMGEVIKINPLTADILTLCRTNDNAEIQNKLADKYTEGEILEVLKTLSGDVGAFLFEMEEPAASAPKTPKSRLRIFVPHSFMKYKDAMSPTLNVGIYNLLAAVAKYADVFVEVDKNSAIMEHREQLMALGIQFVSDLFESNDKTPFIASNRFIIEDCDGILALSPHPHEELNYFRHNTIPIVSRAFSDRKLREATINKVLSHHSLQRSFDAISPDTPWIIEELQTLTGSHFSAVSPILNGVDTQVYSPQDPQHAREAVASIVGIENIPETPFVGFINGFQPQNSIGMIDELATLHKDVVFIVFDPILAHQKYQHHRNVFYINLQKPEDTVALPWIYNACEFIIFPAVIGTPFSMVLEALACGLPGLALISSSLPEDLGDCVKSVQITQEATTSKFVIPTATVSQQIENLLRDSQVRATLSMKAREVAANYSWDRTAKHLIELFTALNEKKTHNAVPNYPDVVFSLYYNKSQNVLRSGAMQLDGYYRHRIEEGLGQTLLAEHTPEEVRIVLKHLLKDAEKADSVLSTLIH